jgi:hypothetical protein
MKSVTWTPTGLQYQKSQHKEDFFSLKKPAGVLPIMLLQNSRTKMQNICIRDHPFLNLASCQHTENQYAEYSEIQMLTMGSRPSPATLFLAWALRHTLRRSSPRSHLCSRGSLWIDPQIPTSYKTRLEQDQATAHTFFIMYSCMRMKNCWSCSTPCVCAYLVVVCRRS